MAGGGRPRQYPTFEDTRAACANYMRALEFGAAPVNKRAAPFFGAPPVRRVGEKGRDSVRLARRLHRRFNLLRIAWRVHRARLGSPGLPLVLQERQRQRLVNVEPECPQFQGRLTNFLHFHFANSCWIGVFDHSTQKSIFHCQPLKRNCAANRYGRRPTASNLATFPSGHLRNYEPPLPSFGAGGEESRPQQHIERSFASLRMTWWQARNAVLKSRGGCGSSGGRPMGGIADNRYTCLDCGSEYTRPMAFIDATRSRAGCPDCASMARRKQRRWFHWARDYAVLMNVE